MCAGDRRRGGRKVRVRPGADCYIPRERAVCATEEDERRQSRARRVVSRAAGTACCTAVVEVRANRGRVEGASCRDADEMVLTDPS